MKRLVAARHDLDSDRLLALLANVFPLQLQLDSDRLSIEQLSRRRLSRGVQRLRRSHCGPRHDRAHCQTCDELSHGISVPVSSKEMLAAWECWFFGSTTNPVCGEDIGYEKGDQLGLMIPGLKTDRSREP